MKELKDKISMLKRELRKAEITLDKKRAKRKRVFTLEEIDIAFHNTIEKELKHLGYHTTIMITDLKQYLEYTS